MSESEVPIKQTILRLKATVLTEGKLEIFAPQLPIGEDVEILILLPESSSSERRSVWDILAEAPGHRQFKTPEQVDAYLREERQGWER